MVAVVGQQIISPGHGLDQVTLNPRQDVEQNHVTRHRRHSTSDGRRHQRHQYEHVRAPHPYENTIIDDDTITSYPRSPHTPHTPREEPVKHSAPRRWAPVKRERLPNSSPAPKRTSDSRIDHSSSKKITTNSPSSAKRFSTGNVIDKPSQGEEQKKLKQRMSSPEMQLHAQMKDRYFPTDEKKSQKTNESPLKEQVSS